MEETLSQLVVSLFRLFPTIAMDPYRAFDKQKAVKHSSKHLSISILT